MGSQISEQHRAAAEEIREHLVTLRGGAPFLSPVDAGLLLMWLDQDEPVSRILAALERAAEARRRRPSRIPLGLKHARAHLKKIPRICSTPNPNHHISDRPPLADLCESLARLGADHPEGLALNELAADLYSVAPGSEEQIIREALGHIREFLNTRWSTLAAQEREQLINSAKESLSTRTGQTDAPTLELLALEQARLVHNLAFPQLTADALWKALQ